VERKLKNYRGVVKLSTTYETIEGDTFVKISAKVYGITSGSTVIASANPGVISPFVAGLTIVIPDLSGAPKNLQQNTDAEQPNETALLIGNQNKRYRLWTNISISRSIDSMDTLEFDSPFDPESSDLREKFRPMSFKSVVVTVGDKPLFTGTMLTPDPKLANDGQTVFVRGYSLPGVLNDCNASAGSYPLDFADQDLRQITQKLAAPFGLDVSFTAQAGAVFEDVTMETSKKVLQFIIALAKQRNLIVASTSDGALLLQQEIATGKPVAILNQGNSPLISVLPIFNPQEYFSHITGIESMQLGLGGSKFTVKNERIDGVIRPFTFNVPDSFEGEVSIAVKAKIGRMFGNTVFYTVELSTWRDSKGELWTPNTTIILQAPNAMIYNNYEFIIRAVRFQQDSDSQTAILNLVLPGTFSGEVPESMPWDE